MHIYFKGVYMRKYIEVKNENDIKWKLEELDKEYGLKNLYIPEGIQDEYKSVAYVDAKTILGDTVTIEGKFNLLKKFLENLNKLKV